MTSNVGADILSVLTESLYDRPIVVFREYVQNSVDAFMAVLRQDESASKADLQSVIVSKDKNLFFIDNGTGIKKEEFYDKMISIAISGKDRMRDIGYKGIGRLSGISYCKKLYFVNIVDYQKGVFDAVYFDTEKYTVVKREGKLSISFDELMQKICVKCDDVCKEYEFIASFLKSEEKIFAKRKTGFLVVMENINALLIDKCVSKKGILDDLGWLLPVPFKDDVVDKYSAMFDDMFCNVGGIEKALPMFDISYNGKKVLRPIGKDSMRDYVAERKLGDFAVSFITFRTDKFQIEGDNFTGLKLYIDNMLLCDEMEIVQYLVQNSFISITARECVQALRGIAGIVYVTDKTYIKSNARRTFIDMTDEGAIQFLMQLSDYTIKINKARYALSEYNRVKKVIEKGKEGEVEKLNSYRTKANDALRDLVQIRVDLLEEEIRDYAALTESERKIVLRNFLQNCIRKKVSDFLNSIDVFAYNRECVWKEFLKFMKGDC